MPFTLRRATLADAPAIARLSGMFGYAPDVEAHAKRLSRLLADPQHAVWVASDGPDVGAWLHAHCRLALESDEWLEISGLVVDETRRGHGLGAALLRCAECWAAEQGLHELRVRSNLLRERAHAFYRREGYAAVKRQQVFVKRL